MNTTTLRTTLKNLHPRTTTGTAVAAGLAATVVLSGASYAVSDDGDKATENTATLAPKLSELADTTGTQADAQRAAAEKAEDLAKSWTSPIEGDYTLSATYGNAGDRWASSHSGQDYAVPTGTEVRAAHSGTVVKAGPNGAGDGPAYGNAIVIKHDDDTYTQYAHLSEIDVQVGQKITTNDEIALSGNTGNSSGPHLHFEVRTTADYGTAIDPMDFLHQHNVNA